MSLIPTNGELWKKVTNTQEREKAPNDIGSDNAKKWKSIEKRH